MVNNIQIEKEGIGMRKHCPDCGCFMQEDEYYNCWHCNNHNCPMFKNDLVLTNDSDYIDFLQNAQESSMDFWDNKEDEHWNDA